MIEQKIINIAQERIRLEIEEQASSLLTSIELVREDMNARGMFGSSAMTRKIVDLCLNSIKNRARLIWQTFQRFITTSGINYSDELSLELKKIIEDFLPESLSDFKNIIESKAPPIDSGNLPSSIASELLKTRDQSLKLVGSDIYLFV